MYNVQVHVFLLLFPSLSPSLLSLPSPSSPLPPSLQEGATGSEVDYQKSDDAICLLQSTQQSMEQQYAVLHCTGFVR